MAAHGAQKALGWFEGPGPEAAGKMMHGLGFRPGTTYASLAAWTEIASGGLIALGLGGPLGPASLISTMIVAQASVHWKNGFFAQKGGIELGALYSAAALAFAATDYGSLSADALLGLREKLKNPVFTALVLSGGVAAAAAILNARDTTPEGPATPTFRGKNSPVPQEEAPAA
jgi:putative oxidoreductase